ncbi:nitroreductase family deazaflavin-dependent oxidoreductase [Subtercola boreus]|uniref:Nitroreductase family deazaflavin-dependent oxidoreductase n=1 Tax=Subtercola boreus TaxID=120213 RepID=A0A3E0VE37_9MICO|nr:nitroreductase/quinone reductase family protein [Subtercola boreus]RFA08184.1 nitroreductase family deazaflavin-dependent oxidoreductase [Subtercola boreus]TQL54925.1 deazaflavin-dependent oxidoreductase (nitroreductase family) [Subtercola boreus]
MDDRAERALAITPASPATSRTIDITTIGARTGAARRIEIWFYRVDGEIYLTTQPATRSWYANLLANPEFTFHLKHGIRADLAATAAPVLDVAERERIFTAIVDDLNQPLHRSYLSQPVEPVNRWVSGSPLMHITFR